VAVAAVIESALSLDDADAGFLRGFSEAPMRNWNGLRVGTLQAAEALRRLAVAP
jgi:hypothetical protein